MTPTLRARLLARVAAFEANGGTPAQLERANRARRLTLVAPRCPTCASRISATNARTSTGGCAWCAGAGDYEA